MQELPTYFEQLVVPQTPNGAATPNRAAIVGMGDCGSATFRSGIEKQFMVRSVWSEFRDASMHRHAHEFRDASLHRPTHAERVIVIKTIHSITWPAYNLPTFAETQLVFQQNQETSRS